VNAVRALLRDPQFRRGAADLAPFAPGIGAWGIVAGVAMVQSGLSVPLALLMSVVVYAGTAQLSALPLIAAGAPMWVIWAAAFCVNLRFVIYSAQWRPYLAHLPRAQRLAITSLSADINFAVFQRRWPRPHPEPGQMPYFLGGGLMLWVVWQSTSVVGILAAGAIPMHWGLGFAGTLAMLGLAYGLIDSRSGAVAAGVSAAAAVATFALPLKLNIVVAIAAAVAAWLLTESLRRRGDAASPP
jgi:predicted branched-subunit amino acid permease